MKLKSLLIALICTATALPALAQEGGIKGTVISRMGREAVGNVTVTIGQTGQTTVTDQNGNFTFQNLPKGDYKLTFEAPEFEDLDIVVSVDQNMRDLNNVVVIPAYNEVMDDSIFAEFDSDMSSNDAQALPTSLASSKDIYNSIASYKFSEMRFNIRGYDSQYTDVYLNGIRFNDAMTNYGPWSLWSGMNDATRNQENTPGIKVTEYGISGIGGTTNINARASQMRKGFRASVSNGNSMYRLRAIVSYASGALDNGWSYAFSVSTRQGGNGYVDGVYYNSYGYFAAAEKAFNSQHRLSLMVLGTPQQRGAQQASTQEAYDLFGSNYYNPNVGYQNGKLRNSRVRTSHEPIVMLNYFYDIDEKTRLTAATSFRFGTNGYSALTWNNGTDPRPDYYRYLPSNYTNQIVDAVDGVFAATSDEEMRNYLLAAESARKTWTGYMDYDGMIRANKREDTNIDYADGYRSTYMIEERHTDQLDWNFAATISHEFNTNHRILGGLNARINRTNYYDKVKDLLGGDYWVDVDKFAERDMGSEPANYQNDLDYYNQYGHARIVKEGDRFSYDYYAQLRQAQLWALYGLNIGGFAMQVGGEVGYSGMWREGLMRKGLFPDNSLGKSEKLNFLTYKVKGNFAYRFSAAHQLEANVAMMQTPPTFQSAFVSPRTRNSVNEGLTPEKIFSAELTYNLNLPYIKARLSGFYTTMNDMSKIISFYDDTQSSFTNFVMSNIDKRYYGLEFGFSVPIWNGLAFQGALSWGNYTYTSNPDFIQYVDNRDKEVLRDKVNWKGYKIENTPQMALNVGLNWRAPKNWFASIDFNYYRDLYLSMNPAYRTENAIQAYEKVFNPNPGKVIERKTKEWAFDQYNSLIEEENLGDAFTLNASLGKNWYIQRKYTLGFSIEVKNITNNRNIRTGGYEQMRLRRTRGLDGTGGGPTESYYERFDSKYFYMLGTTYYLNVYFRF